MELRLYSFVNFYLSSIQQGVQTGHAAVDLVRKYTAHGNPFRVDITSSQENAVAEWADEHKTFIILNGGNAERLAQITDVISSNGNFPWVTFNEDDQSLNGIQTCVAVVLPACIFNAKMVRQPNGDDFYLWQERNEEGEVVEEMIYDVRHEHYALIDIIKNSRLAS